MGRHGGVGYGIQQQPRAIKQAEGAAGSRQGMQNGIPLDAPRLADKQGEGFTRNGGGHCDGEAGPVDFNGMPREQNRVQTIQIQEFEEIRIAKARIRQPLIDEQGTRRGKGGDGRGGGTGCAGAQLPSAGDAAEAVIGGLRAVSDAILKLIGSVEELDFTVVVLQAS